MSQRYKVKVRRPFYWRQRLRKRGAILVMSAVQARAAAAEGKIYERPVIGPSETKPTEPSETKAGHVVSSVELENWTVAELQDELRDRGLKVSGAKDELVARLYAASSSSQEE